jgi:hypothetical protein
VQVGNGREPRCKFFMWLALLGRCWTSAIAQSGQRWTMRLLRPGRANNPSGCSFSREIWFRLLRHAGFPFLTPQQDDRTRRMVARDSTLWFMGGLIWKGRNSRVFSRSSRTVMSLINHIIEMKLLFGWQRVTPLWSNTCSSSASVSCVASAALAKSLASCLCFSFVHCGGRWLFPAVSCNKTLLFLMS